MDASTSGKKLKVTIKDIEGKSNFYKVIYKDENYSILQPIDLFEGMAEDEAFVFKIGKTETGEDRFEMITDDELIDKVFAEYNKTLLK